MLDHRGSFQIKFLTVTLILVALGFLGLFLFNQKLTLDKFQSQVKQLDDEKSFLKTQIQNFREDISYQLKVEELLKEAKYNEAIDVVNEAIATSEKVFGMDSLEATRWYIRLAELNEAKGSAPEAKALFERSARNLSELLGSDHPLTWRVNEQIKSLNEGLGDNFDPAKYEGRYALLYFWSTTSPTFENDLLDLKQLHRQLQTLDNIELISINLDTTPEVSASKMKSYFENLEITWQQLFDKRGLLSPVAQRYNVQTLPYVVLLDPESNVLSQHQKLSFVQAILGKRLGVRITGYAVGQNGQIQGEMRYLNTPLTKITQAKPTIQLRNLDTNQVLDLAADIEGDYYKVRNIPLGRYRLNMQIDANEQNPKNYPGDLIAETTFDLNESKETINLPIALRYIMHLVKPIDSNKLLPSEPKIHKRGMAFLWRPVPQATHYVYKIGRTTLEGAIPKSESTKETKKPVAKVKLGALNDGEFYTFKLEAFNKDTPIGILQVRGEEFTTNTEYFFKVK